MAEVRLRGLRKSFDKVEVIHGVDCDITDGEFLVVVGPSGCGKSTLLRMIAGLERIDVGEIAIAGRVVNDLDPADRDIAMVFQNYALYPHMSVFDNMAYSLKIRRMPKAEIRERVDKVSKILELHQLLDRRPSQLSGGQRQRVAMGRAIVREPSVFLFGEPLSNLDAKLRVQMRIEIKRLQNRLGITSVYVTHDQVEAMTLGHRLLVMNDGSVEQIGSPLELYDRPATIFVGGFIGSPAMNFLAARIASDGDVVELSGGDRLSPAHRGLASHRGRPITLGIRPEHLKIATDGTGEVRLKVDVVEELGADTLVHGHFGSDDTGLTARLPGARNIKAGEVLGLSVEPGQVHAFDAESGASLGGS